MAHACTEERASTDFHRDRHRRVVRRIDTILACNADGSRRSMLVVKLTQLHEILLQYFRETEQQLATIRTPGREAFVIAHARLLHEYELHVRRFNAGHDGLGKDFAEFLRLWLRLHILHAYPVTDRTGKAARSRTQQSLQCSRPGMSPSAKHGS